MMVAVSVRKTVEMLVALSVDLMVEMMVAVSVRKTVEMLVALSVC